MKLMEILPTLIGRKIDYDGAYGNQCVDLARVWWKTLGARQLPGVDGAVDFWEKFDPSKSVNWQKIPPGELREGDAVIFDKTEKNKYGHIALFLAMDGGDIITVDQNWPSGAGEAVGVFRHPLNMRVLGGLRWMG